MNWSRYAAFMVTCDRDGLNMVHLHHYNTRKPTLSPLSVIINPTFRSSLEFYRIKRAPFTVSGIGNTRFFSILIGHTFSNKIKFFTKYLTVPPGDRQLAVRSSRIGRLSSLGRRREIALTIPLKNQSLSVMRETVSTVVCSIRALPL